MGQLKLKMRQAEVSLLQHSVKILPEEYNRFENGASNKVTSYAKRSHLYYILI